MQGYGQRAIAAAILCLCAGCNSQQLYATTQGYQRNQCEHLPDQGERDKCLESANTSYDLYRRESAPGSN
jgi:hypothetical protein